MKSSKRILALLLCIMTVVSCFAFASPASAASKSYGFNMNVAYDATAKTVTATVTVIEDDIIGAAMSIGYDPAALTLLDKEGNEGTPKDYADLYENYFGLNEVILPTNAGTLDEVYDKSAASMFIAYIINVGQDIDSFAKGDEVMTLRFKVKDESKLDTLASVNKLVYFATPVNKNYPDPYLLYNYTETIKKTENGEIVDVEITRNGKAYFNHSPKITLKYEYDGIDADVKTNTFTVNVVDEKGKPLAGAKVKIDTETQTTDKDGNATFTLPYGEYSVIVTLDGYTIAESGISVGDKVDDVDVTIKKLSAPEAPGKPTVSATSTTSVTLKWTAPDSDGNSAITGYKISYGKTSSADTSTVDVAGSLVLSKKITSLTSGTKYYFKVAAVNDIGVGEYSDVVSATTDTQSSSGGTTGGSTGGGAAGGNTTVYYTVTYNIGAGTYIGNLNENVQAGRTPSKAPTVTAPAGKTFKGWSTDGKTVKNLSAINVTANITLYAVYEDVPTETAASHKAFMTGYTDGTARPDKTITRKEAVTLIARICDDFDENKAYTSSTFSDVADGAWYKKYVDYVVEKGYVTGYSDGTFRPDKEINREEFSTILFRLGGFEVDVSKTFTDVPESHWAKNNISTLAAKGIITGYSDGTFGLGKSIKRAEAVTMLNRYLGRVPNADLVNAAYNGVTLPASDISGHWAFAQMIEAMVDHDKAKFHG